MNVMILAAGEGTRLRPYTLIKPKPAIPFLNIPLAFYSLGLLENIIVDKYVVNTFHLPEKIVQTFDGLHLPSKKLQYSHETGVIQGSGGGLKQAERFFDHRQEIIMLNGDEVILPKTSRTVETALKQHRAQNSLATLFVMDHEEVGKKFGGIWVDDHENILAIGKTRPNDVTKGLHFVGVFIFSPRIFEYLPAGPSHIFTDVLVPSMRAGEKVNIFKIDALWFETGNIEDYLKATDACVSLLQSQSAESRYLKRTITRFSPQTKFDANVVSASPLPKDFAAEGFAIIGRDVTLGSNVKLKNSVVDSFFKIEEGASAVDQLFLKN